MNLNDFVVIPNKAKSVKLNARNLRELRMETVTLAQESKDMEDRLQQLRQSMSREKEERERSGGFRWKSGQAGAVYNHSAKRNKESGLQKLSTGKVKILLLKDQPQTEVCRVGEKDTTPAALSGGQVSSRKTRLRGKVCGQCEAKAAGLICAECGEDYCVGCFAKFHQKGVLKLHRMIPIQTEIQTSVTSLDVVSHFQRQVQPKPDSQTAGSGGGARGPERRTQAAPAVKHTHNAQGSQVLVVNPSMEEEEEVDELEEEEEKEMLGGDYDEEESARSFQEALRQWRGERREGGERAQRGERGDAIWRPCQARSVMGTQADLSDSGAERGPVKVEFTQHSLSYMDRLLIKRHRRTPIQAYQPLSSLASTHTHTLEEELTHTLTAEDVELRRYCASLFAVSSCGGSAEPEPSPGSCLSIEELDDTVGDGGFFTEQNSEDNTKQEEINVIGGPNLSHNALSQGAMLSGSPVTRSPRPALVSKAGTVQIPQPDHTTERSPRSTTGSPQPRGPETPRSSTKTPAKSTQTDRSYNLHQSTLDPSSPSPSPATPNPDLLSAGPPSSLSPSPPALHSLRSTFTLSPLSPTEPESPLLPRSPRASRFIYPSSPPVHLPDRLSPPKPLSLRSQSSPSPSEPLMSTLPYSQSPSKLLSSKSERTKLPLNPLSSLSPGSPVSYRSPPKPLSTTSPSTPSPPDALSSRNVSTPSPEDSVSPVSSPHPLTARLSSRYVSSPSQEEPLYTRPHTTHSYTEVQSAMSPHPSPSPSLMSDPLHLPLTQSPPHSSDSLRNYSSQETPRLLSESGIRKSHSPVLFPRMPATDFDMESSSDSLGLTPREEESSDEEMKTNRCLEEWRGRAEDRCSTLLPEGSPVFLTALHPEPETGELVQEPSMALRVLAQREQTQAGSFCGLEGFLMLGLVDLSSPQPSPRPTHSHPDTQDNAHMLTTGADSWMPSSSLRACAEEHLVSTVMMNSHSQSISCHSHVATPTRRGASSGHGLYTSGRSTPRLSSRPTSAVSRPVSGTMSQPVSRPLSRAAQEILDICLVDQTGCEDPDLEQDVDTQALSSLAEEFRLMATDSDLPQVSPSPGGGAETEGRVRRRGSLRLGARECHSDEEEDTLRDQQSVLSLP